MRPENILVVLFTVIGNQVFGVIQSDYKTVSLSADEVARLKHDARYNGYYYDDDYYRNIKIPRKKIVFLNGYNREQPKTWQGDLPKDGETWEVIECRDTKPGDPRTGVLFVKLYKNQSDEKRIADENKRQELMPIIIALGSADVRPNEEIREAEIVRSLAEIFKENQAVGMLNKALSLKDYFSAMKFLFENASFFARDFLDSKIPAESWREYLAAALTWLESTGYKQTEIAFEDIGHRNFKCKSCPAVIRLTKSDYKEYLSDNDYSIECPFCFNKGTIIRRQEVLDAQ